MRRPAVSIRRRAPGGAGRAYPATVIALLVVLAAVVFLNGFGHFYTDIKPEVYLAPGRMILAYLSSWTQSPYLGAPSFNVGLVPVLGVLAPLRAIGLSPELTYKLFHFALWTLTAWGAARLLRATYARADRWTGLAAGVLYLANPYTIQAGSTLAIALPMALLPWMMLVFLRALQDPRGWRWPAIFGLIFFAMSGMNVAVVPILQLFALLPLMVAARCSWRIGWLDIARALAKCALFTVGVSLYWLVPAAAALSTGSQIVSSSETITGIAKTGSFPEVLRGLGLWPLYGRDANGPWEGQYAGYITSPLLILMTALWPVLGMLALRWCRGFVRGLVIGLLAIAAVVSVGAFPTQSAPASPFGHVVVAFLQLPGMGAFRTTNKIGALLALGFAMALGVAAREVWRRLSTVDFWAPVAAMVAVVLVTAWVSPALTNRLYLSPMDIPGYWHQAASAIDKGDPNAAVLFLPGQTRPQYRWTVPRPDDVANSLFSRTVIIPETTPNASVPGANYLTALNSTLQNGVVPPAAMSAYARYLGADTILLRHDIDWEDTGGARPAVTSKVLAADPGLVGVANYGVDGEFTQAPGYDPAAYGEDRLPPLQRYAVTDPLRSVRAEPTADSVLVAGDGSSVAQLSSAGLLRAAPSFQYALDVGAAQLPGMLGRGHRLVITDTNARRSAVTNRLSNGTGPLLTARQPLTQSYALGTDPADQTVLVPSGAKVTASSEGGAFFDLPYAAAQNALDGDPSTSWLFGDFGRAPGQTLTITEPSPITPGTVRISQSSVGAAKIDRLTVTAGDRSVTRRMPDTGYASFDMGTARTTTVTVRVDSERGNGYNLVGISDIKMAGPLALGAARTPTTFSDRYASLDAAGRAAFAATPLSVLLTRLQGTPAPGDDEQTGLRRIVTLPDARTFTDAAAVRVDGPVEPVYDQVAGYSAAVRATSSRFYFDDPAVRASQAADPGPSKNSTAWVPGDGVRGSWWQVAGPIRSIDSVAVTQAAGPGDQTPDAARTQWATSAVITVDGRRVASTDLKPAGTTKVAFPKITGRVVRVTFTGATEPPQGIPARFPSIDTGISMRVGSSGRLGPVGGAAARCLTVATIDGRAVTMRPTTTRLAGATSQGTRWTGCADTSMTAGAHRIEQAPGFTLDSFALTDARTAPATVPADTIVSDVHDGATSKSLRVRSGGAFAVVISESYDPRWQATANGKSLGVPQVLDGFSVGWKLPAGGTYDIVVRYGPQRWSTVALVISSVILLLAILLGTGLGHRLAVSWSRRRRARQARGMEEDTDPERDAVTDPVTADASAMVSAEVPRAGAAAGAWPRPMPRIGVEIALVLAGVFFLGYAGLVASVAVVAVLRWAPVPSQWLITAGAVLVAVSVVVYVIVLWSEGLTGQVSADAVSASLWPHYLGAAGLLIALVGALRDHVPLTTSSPAPHTAPDHRLEHPVDSHH
ncbi:MAG: alpha-(1-_3)-arabinofuranosyltransferase [Actinomycetota bacterium]|nr:alpha-(1->3)-arabinofuranosyltransferase [Actinomycetota bacterium]